MNPAANRGCRHLQWEVELVWMQAAWLLFLLLAAPAVAWDEPEVRSYTADLMRSLDPSFGEECQLVDTGRPVASVVPGKALLLSSAAFRIAASEAELAAMLAHAMAHAAAFDRGKATPPVPAWGLCYRSGTDSAAPPPAAAAAEQSADLRAVELLAAAGYDPRSLAAVYARWRRAPLPGARVRARAAALSERWAELIEDTSRFEELRSRVAGH